MSFTLVSISFGFTFCIVSARAIFSYAVSGSGKTTLLNCIATIDKVTAGKILINNQDITKLKGNKLNKFRREELGFIFQDFNYIIYCFLFCTIYLSYINLTVL